MLTSPSKLKKMELTSTDGHQWVVGSTVRNSNLLKINTAVNSMDKELTFSASSRTEKMSEQSQQGHSQQKKQKKHQVLYKCNKPVKQY